MAAIRRRPHRDLGSRTSPVCPAPNFTEARTGTAYTVAFDPTPLHGIGLYINPARFSIVQRSGQPEVEALLLGVDPQVPERAGVERRTPRYAIYAHLHDKQSGQDLWVANIHTTEGASKLETTERLAQVTAAADRAKRFDGPVIFLGDFNQARTPQADPVLDAFGDRSGFIDSQDRAKGIENANTDSYQGWATVPRTTPGGFGHHIDRVLVRDEVEIGYWAVQTTLPKSGQRSLGSDHVPIVVSVAVGRLQ